MTSGNEQNSSLAGELNVNTVESAQRAGKHTPEQRDAILAHRAAQLAQPLSNLHEDSTSALAANAALIFALGDEYYAFPAHQVREVRPLAEVTRVPGTPAFVAGLVNLRGRIVPVLDLRVFFGLPIKSLGSSNTFVVMLRSIRGDVGVLADSCPTVQTMGERLGRLPQTAPSGLQAAYVRGVTPELVVMLDAELLLADKHIVVQVEV